MLSDTGLARFSTHQLAGAEAGQSPSFFMCLIPRRVHSHSEFGKVGESLVRSPESFMSLVPLAGLPAGTHRTLARRVVAISLAVAAGSRGAQDVRADRVPPSEDTP